MPLRRMLATWTVLALPSFVACGHTEAPTVVKAPPVTIAHVETDDLQDCIGASGELVARLHTTISAEVSGRVTQLLRNEGQPVTAGEVMLEIDPQRRELETEAARARVAKAVASLEKERRETRRMRTLREQDVASAQRLEAAETALAIANANAAAERAQLGVAERAAADASVTAPFEGLVARRLVNVGQFVQVGTPLFELVSLDPIEVVFHIAEIDSGRVAVGQKVDVTVAPYPDRTFEAVVDVISPTIDTEARTLRVKASLANPDGMLRPGLFARANLDVAQRKGVLLVPEEAVLQRADGPVIFALVDGNRVERRVVKTGGFHEGRIEIVQGAKAGENVVVRGHMALVDGAVVRVPAGNDDLAGTSLATTPNSLASDSL